MQTRHQLRKDALSPYQAYRVRSFNACGLYDAAAISDGLRRLAAKRKPKRK